MNSLMNVRIIQLALTQESELNIIEKKENNSDRNKQKSAWMAERAKKSINCVELVIRLSSYLSRAFILLHGISNMIWFR